MWQSHPRTLAKRRLNADLPPCHLLRRLAAILYDTFLLVAVLFFAAALPLLFSSGEASGRFNPWMTAWLLLVGFLFFGWFWTHGGQTLGMRAWRIQIRSTAGGTVTWRHALLRYLAALLSWAAFGLGFWWSMIDQKRLAWHDRCSGTVLVVLPRGS